MKQFFLGLSWPTGVWGWIAAGVFVAVVVLAILGYGGGWAPWGPGSGNGVNVCLEACQKDFPLDVDQRRICEISCKQPG